MKTFSCLLLLVAAATGHGCPHAWVFYDDECYYFSYDKSTWHEAVDRCQEAGGFLLDIDSQEENQFIFDFVKNNFPPNHNRIYIGMSDYREEGNWIKEHTGSRSWYEHWQDGEPNNGLSGAPQDCVIMGSNGKWDDTYCNNEYRYVCEQRSNR